MLFFKIKNDVGSPLRLASDEVARSEAQAVQRRRARQRVLAATRSASVLSLARPQPDPDVLLELLEPNVDSSLAWTTPRRHPIPLALRK